jgi:O-antigen/teichoic acid export membrane protein
MTPAGARGVAWSGVEAASAAGLSLVSAFLIARLIGAGELGIGAAAVSVHVLLWVTVNALFGDALVQREDLDDVAIWSALWTSIAVGGLALAIQAAAGWILAWLLDDRRLVAMALWLALPLPLVGAAGVAQGMLTRARGYRQLAGRTIVGQGLGTLTGVVVALAGGGAWAVVGQQLVTSVVGALALLVGAAWHPRLVWHWPPVRGLLAVGLPLTASTLVLHARYRLFALLIGGTAGAAALGQVHVAFRLVDTLRELSFTALWRLMLPALSERQNDKVALLAAVDRLLARSSLVTLPLCGAMAVSLSPMVALLLGPDWAASGVASEPLIALMALLALMFPAGVALVAVGKAHYALIANLAGILATGAAVILIGPADPLQAVLVWCGSQLVVSPYTLWINGRALGVGPLRPLRAGLAMLVVTGVAVAIVLLSPMAIAQPLFPVQLIVVRLAIGGLVVGIGARLVLRRRVTTVMAASAGE